MAASRPPPIPRKKNAPVRHRAGPMTPEQRAGKARVKAAKLCTSAFYTAIIGGASRRSHSCTSWCNW